MKKSLPLQAFLTIIVICLFSPSPVLAQNAPRLNWLEYFGVLSKGELIDNNSHEVIGLVGALDTVTGSNISSGILRHEDFPLNNAFYYLPEIQEQLFNEVSQTPLGSTYDEMEITPDFHSTNDMRIEAGWEITLHADDPDAIFVFNVEGDLFFGPDSKVILDNVKAENVYWNIRGDLTIEHGTEIYGIFLTTGNATIYNDVSGKISVLSQANVEMGESDVFFSRRVIELNSDTLVVDYYLSATIIGESASATVCSNGTVQTWGANISGMLGNGTYGPTYSNTPATVAGLTDVVAVAIGGVHILVLKKDGTVWGWGQNEVGELGDGTNVSKYTPVQVSGITNAVAIAAGLQFSMALLTDGTVMTWGANARGELGTTTKRRNIPAAVASLTGVKGIAAGPYSAYALLTNGQLRSWGNNRRGELGNGSTVDTYLPQTVTGLQNVVSISVAACPRVGTNANTPYYASDNGGHVMALLADGTVRTWGENYTGVLGTASVPVSIRNDISYSSIPVTPDGLGNTVVEVEAGDGLCFARLRDGSIKVWGYIGQYGGGVCGQTSDYYSSTPVNGPSISNVTKIIATKHWMGHGLTTQKVILANGGIKAWGYGATGQLGNGTYTNTCTPVSVSSTCDAVTNPWPNVWTLLDFDWSSYNNSQNAEITFNNKSTFGTSFSWNFGDGSSVLNSNSATVTHTFLYPGYYNITLTGTTSFGSSSISKVIYIIPRNLAANYNPYPGCVENTAMYDYFDFNSDTSYKPESPQHWTTDKVIGGTLRIVSGSGVVIDPGVTYSFGPQGKIIVEEGASLTLNGCTLTGIDYGSPCGKIMWMGIEVLGKAEYPSGHQQGNIVLRNRAVIQDAHIGITLGENVLNPLGNKFAYRYHDVRKSGGELSIPLIEDTTACIFNRNGTAILVWERPQSSTPGSVVIKKCYFQSKEGSTNVDLLDPNYTFGYGGLYNTTEAMALKDHNPFWSALPPNVPGNKHAGNFSVFLNGINGVVIRDNIFDNADVQVQSFNAGYLLADNEFYNSFKAINVGGTSSSMIPRNITRNLFDNNYYGILSSGSQYDLISKNGFNDGATNPVSYNAIELTNAGNFSVLDNIVNYTDVAISIKNKSYGGIRNQKEASLIGYAELGNVMLNCKTAIQVNGDNDGLQMRCNTFVNGSLDFYAEHWKVAGSLLSQGYPDDSRIVLSKAQKPAGNKFDQGAGSPRRDIDASGVGNTFHYYHHNQDYTIPVNKNILVGTRVPKMIPVSNHVNYTSDNASCSREVVVTEPDQPVAEISLRSDTLLLLEGEYSQLLEQLDGGETTMLLANIDEDESILTDLLTAYSPLSEEVLLAVLQRNQPISDPANFKEIMLRNLPASDTVWRLVLPQIEAFNELELDTLLPMLQGLNPEYQTLTSIRRNIKAVEQDRRLILNDLFRFYQGISTEESEYVDILNYTETPVEDLAGLLEDEATEETDRLLVAYYLDHNDTLQAENKLNGINIVDDHDQAFYDLHALYLALKKEQRSIWQLTGPEEGMVRGIANICPVTAPVLQAQNVLLLVYGDTILSCQGSGSRIAGPIKQKVASGHKDNYLGNNYPNPFADYTTITYKVPREYRTCLLRVSDLQGRIIREVKLDKQDEKLLLWTGNMERGVYFYSLVADGKVMATKKMILVR